MNTKIKKLLEEGQVDGFFAYKTIHGFFFPYLFTRENVNELEPWKSSQARYPIVKVLLAQARKNPEKTYGVLVRGCEERALNELYKWNQLQRDKVVVLGQACTEDLASHCECWKPFPSRIDYGAEVSPVEESRKVQDLEKMAEAERLKWWLSHFNRCVKCFGCRDVCPVCFCTECSLEQKKLIPADKLPPDTSFHLVRAVHMAGRCIDCGLCEEVCPSKIPLRALYKEVGKLVEKVFDYKPGADDGKSPFSFLGEESLLPHGPR
jgi:ferredoxin